jgi:hypothetical protein
MSLKLIVRPEAEKDILNAPLPMPVRRNQVVRSIKSF